MQPLVELRRGHELASSVQEKKALHGGRRRTTEVPWGGGAALPRGSRL